MPQTDLLLEFHPTNVASFAKFAQCFYFVLANAKENAFALKCNPLEKNKKSFNNFLVDLMSAKIARKSDIPLIHTSNQANVFSYCKWDVYWSVITTMKLEFISSFA